MLIVIITEEEVTSLRGAQELEGQKDGNDVEYL